MIWEIKAGPLSDWREWEAKARDDFSYEKLLPLRQFLIL